MITEIVEEFCQQQGMPGVRVREGESLTFAIESVGDFRITYRHQQLFTSLARTVSNYQTPDARTILAHCHFRQELPWPLHARLQDLTVTFAFVFEESEVTLPVLAKSFETLVGVMDRATGTR